MIRRWRFTDGAPDGFSPVMRRFSWPGNPAGAPLLLPSSRDSWRTLEVLWIVMAEGGGITTPSIIRHRRWHLNPVVNLPITNKTPAKSNDKWSQWISVTSRKVFRPGFIRRRLKSDIYWAAVSESLESYSSFTQTAPRCFICLFLLLIYSHLSINFHCFFVQFDFELFAGALTSGGRIAKWMKRPPASGGAAVGNRKMDSFPFLNQRDKK